MLMTDTFATMTTSAVLLPDDETMLIVAALRRNPPAPWGGINVMTLVNRNK
jgi:hypothetical protein